MYSGIESRFVSGDLHAAEVEAHRVTPLVAADGPVWAARFRLQLARIELYQGHSREALALLEPPLPGADGGSPDASLSVTRDTLLSIAYVRTGNLARAEQVLAAAQTKCKGEHSRAEVRLAEGVVDVEKGKLDDAEHVFALGLASARASGDKFQQTQALLNIGVVTLRQDHYDEALNRFHEAAAIAREIGARLAQEKAEGGAGSTLYKVGDFPQALANAQAAAEQARVLGAPIDQAGFLYDAGMSQYRLGELKAARSSFEESYRLARSIQNNEETGDALFALASVSLQQGDATGTLAQAREAEGVAAQSGNPAAALQPLLLEAQALAQRGDVAGARAKLLSLLGGEAGVPRPFVRWQLESTLAKLAEATGDAASAEAWFQRAIQTFRLQRETLGQIESRLPFTESGTGLYLDYMEELLGTSKAREALLVLDRSRAETLTESPANTTAKVAGSGQDWKANPSALARRLHGTILVYCLRPHASYMWAIGPGGSAFFRIAGKELILPLVESHTRAILSSRDVLAQENGPGLALYRELVAPAKAFLAPGGKVFVIADVGLSRLNFETLIPPPAAAATSERPPHFWIEDVDVVNAKSLSLLAAGSSALMLSKGEHTNGKRLLLVGDPVYAGHEYAQLPHAAEEVTQVAGHFPQDHRVLLTQTQATRSAYRASHPEEFAFIHFVAHATASETNPLDSAVILSGQPGDPDTYKLYARDILNSRIHADLVTLSACFGSGVRSYSGEGLVGLAWAFLHAGSHNVIGALWEVSDVSTPQLMNDLYAGLASGQSPDVALRSAKLAMIGRGGAFRKPLYWAAFQLYSGA